MAIDLWRGLAEVIAQSQCLLALLLIEGRHHGIQPFVIPVVLIDIASKDATYHLALIGNLESEWCAIPSIADDILAHQQSELVAQHFRATREVSFYAEQLCITTTYLYKLTHRRWNLSPKELIDQQTICEIKTLLSSTDMSVKEIAAMLHFEDTPYMCRYFRRRTGLSPTEYRNDTTKS